MPKKGMTKELIVHVIDIAYALTPNTNNYWTLVDKVMEAVAKMYDDKISEVCLTMDHAEIMKWEPSETEYKIPTFPINSR